MVATNQIDEKDERSNQKQKKKDMDLVCVVITAMIGTLAAVCIGSLFGTEIAMAEVKPVLKELLAQLRDLRTAVEGQQHLVSPPRASSDANTFTMDTGGRGSRATVVAAGNVPTPPEWRVADAKVAATSTIRCDRHFIVMPDELLPGDCVHTSGGKYDWPVQRGVRAAAGAAADEDTHTHCLLRHDLVGCRLTLYTVDRNNREASPRIVWQAPWSDKMQTAVCESPVLAMQHDGNLVFYASAEIMTPGTAMFATGTHQKYLDGMRWGRKGARAYVDNACRLEVADADDDVLWRSH